MRLIVTYTKVVALLLVVCMSTWTISGCVPAVETSTETSSGSASPAPETSSPETPAEPEAGSTTGGGIALPDEGDDAKAGDAADPDAVEVENGGLD